jgi:hypothetical protein
MLPAGVELWSLDKAGEAALGLCCTEDGLFLGRALLVEKRGACFAVRPRGELERLLRRSHSDGLDRLIRGLGVVKSALDENNLCLAQIAAVQLRVPPLPDLFARSELEAEDMLIKAERRGEVLARGGWDPAEHPRAGVPPNPGWFAPTDGAGGGALPEIAQEEDERAPEEMLDPLASVRQAQWDAAIATLREIDPNNPNLSYLANPGSPPNQAALDRLNAAVEAAAIKRVTDKLMPNGKPIGERGRGPDVRVMPGGPKEAQALFDYLRIGGTVWEEEAERTVIRLPLDAGYITYRANSRSGGPAIDINMLSLGFDKIHFRQGGLIGHLDRNR